MRLAIAGTMPEPELRGTISRRGIFTDPIANISAAVSFGRAWAPISGPQRHQVSVTIGPREYFGVHVEGQTVKLFRKRPSKGKLSRGRP